MKSKESFYNDISKHLGIDINDNTEFFDKIGISGADADEFILWLHNNYNVDFSAFNYKEYYVADGDNFIRLIFDRFYKEKNAY